MPKQSDYTPYHEEIKQLLISGMTIQDTYQYLEEKHKIGRSYNSFWSYVYRYGLNQYVSEKVKKKHKGGRNGIRKGKPAGCTFPNCFECLMKECVYNGEMGRSIRGEELYDMSKVLLEGR